MQAAAEHNIETKLSDIDQKNQPIETIKSEDEQQTTYLTTAERIVLKSIIETFWAVLKEKHKEQCKKTSNQNLFDYYELGKIYSNLIIDEIVPKQKNNLKQKTVELLVPTAIAFSVNNLVYTDKNPNYTEFFSNLCVKLLCKLMMVRWFQTYGTTSYRVANDAALLGTFYKFDKDKEGIFKYISVYNAAEKIPLDLLRGYIQSKAINLGPFLNQKHRKKAIAKTAQVIALPILQCTLNNIANLITSN